MIHTNRCKRCGKSKEKHYTGLLYCDELTGRGDDLYDSQLFEGQEVPKRVKEITRLRELLDGSKDLLLVASTGYAQIEFLERVKKLITEIDNALDPSGPHAMGPGH